MNVQVAVSDVADCEKELAIEIDAGEVREEYQKAYSAYARYAKVPGFRQGNVPVSVIKQRYAKEIKDEVLQQMVPHALSHAIQDHKLNVIGNPDIDPQAIELREGQPLKFKSRVTVVPDFELLTYKGLQLKRKVARVTDESVEKTLAGLRDHAAQLVPVEDRASRTGDFVGINLVGKYIDPPEDEDLTSDDLTIEIGGEGVQQEFTDNLTGVKEGDVRTFTVKYPEDFTSKGLANKTLEFSATVVSVKFKELPELDDDFAKEIAEEYKESYTTLDGLRARIREDLEAQANDEAETALRDSLLEELVKGYEFPLPAPLVENQTKNRINDFIQRLIRSGVPPQAASSLNWEERRAEESARAERDVRVALVLGAIADKEKIVISQQDVDNEIERIAEGMGQTPDEIEERLTKSGTLSSIQNRLRTDKVMGFLVDAAEVTREEFDENLVTADPEGSEKADGEKA